MEGISKRKKPTEKELYKKMYYHLFNAITDAINTENKTQSDEILKQAQIETEEIYISQSF